MPPLFDKEETRERLRKLPGGATQPLTVHLRQEIDRLNVVLSTTKTTLTDLRLAIAGASEPQIRLRPLCMARLRGLSPPWPGTLAAQREALAKLARNACARNVRLAAQARSPSAAA